MLLFLILCLSDPEAEARALLALAIAAQRPRAETVSPPLETAPTGSYQSARAESIRTGKPLIVWVGGNFCERCVNDSQNEFCHAFVPDGWDGVRGPATVVAAPHGEHTYYVGVVTRWTVGSHDWGHIPSARRIVNEWRRRAKEGVLSPLRLINHGDGNWGWPADRSSLPVDGSTARRIPSRAGAPASSFRSARSSRSGC